MKGSDFSVLSKLFADESERLGFGNAEVNFVEAYLDMTAEERKQFHNFYSSELNYRDYAISTYSESFGSEAISSLAKQIIADAGIVMNEKPVFDKPDPNILGEWKYNRL